MSNAVRLVVEVRQVAVTVGQVVLVLPGDLILRDRRSAGVVVVPLLTSFES